MKSRTVYSGRLFYFWSVLRSIVTVCFLLCSVSHYAQVQRVVLLEQFTHVNCELCEDYNRAFEAIKTNFGDTIIDIRYATSSPDPFYLQNTTEQDERMNYYGVGLPAHTILDGSFYNGNTAQFSTSLVDDRKTSAPKFDIQLSHQVSPNYDSVHVEMIFQSKHFIANGQVSARIAVVEREVQFDFPPGTNGETRFFNMLRKFLPDALGVQLPTPVQNGYADTLHFSWGFENVVCPSEIGVVGFVQNDAIKGVYQAAWSEPDLQPTYSHDIELISVAASGDFLTPEVCGYNLSPLVKLKNMGSTILTNLDFGIQVNNEPTQYRQWQGTDSIFHVAFIDLSEVSFEPTAQNQLKIWSESPNNSLDQNPRNDTLVEQFPRATSGFVAPITLELQLDSFPDETTWSIKTDLGEVVHSGGPYQVLEGMVTESFTLSPNLCFHFEISDTYGDGLCCEWGAGSYRLVDANNMIIVEGDSFRWQEIHPFSLDIWPVGGQYLDETTDPRIAVSALGNGEYLVSWKNFNPAHLYIYNIAGVLSQKADIADGAKSELIELNANPAALYLIQLVGNEGGKLGSTLLKTW